MDILQAAWSTIVSNAPNLVGFVLPPFVEILNRDVKDDREKFIVSLLTCLFVAVLLHWNEIVSGSPTQAVTYFAIVFVEMKTVFNLYFAKSWMRDVIQTKLTKEEDKPIVQVEGAEAVVNQ